MPIGFPLLGGVLVLIIVLALRYRRVGRHYDEETDAFWRRELDADTSVRRDVDLSALPYLTVPLSKFPQDAALTADEEYMELIRQIKALSDQRILNLTGKTNTDLKLEYGRNHLDEMQKIGDAYNSLSVLLVSVAKKLMDLHRYEDALPVLEYGVSTGTDVSSNYTLLGDCYANTGHAYKIRDLIETVEGTDMVMKTSILQHLRPLLPEEKEKENFSAPD